MNSFSRISISIYASISIELNAIYKSYKSCYEKKKRKNELRYLYLLSFIFLLSFVLKIKRTLLFDPLFSTREREREREIIQFPSN